jgi:hypothetical protein
MAALLSLRLMPIIYCVLAGAIVAGAWWLVDTIREEARQEERAVFAEAARVKNIDLDKYATTQEALDAIIESELAKRVGAAGTVQSDLHYTAEQAAAISAIRKAGSNAH